VVEQKEKLKQEEEQRAREALEDLRKKATEI